ncbi:MAG: patatin-like phospholipase family protein [Betaproteobacteria bacterium]|nr:patatin-like phospholipase family protein [Betaproteobacteria bacterium]
MNARHLVSPRSLVLSTAIALLATHSSGPAAQTAPVATAATAPRIGLALSGGGARGLAHVGVLKVLEELRVPIHCVTGTSMGAIVGGTFAAGTPPAEMEKIVLAADWAEIFRDRPPREEIAIRSKIDDYKTLFAPEFGVKDGGLALPKGVIAGVSIESFFRVLATRAFGVTDFRKLPIPFRAMATDIETGESVVLERGSVAQAMRASMSVPGAIAPVEIDGRLLVDGGIANNLPIDEARKLCADVVIAVNISTPPLKRKDITSALSVAGQLVNFLGKQTVDEQLKSLGNKDVLIAPDLGDISAATFDRSAEAVRIGEQATRALADSLRRYSLPPDRYAALRATQIVEEKALGSVGEVRFEGLERSNPEVLRGLVESKPGEPLSEAKIGADLRRVYGSGGFESISYHISGEGGPRALVIEPKEKSWGPDFLRFGLGLASDFQGDSQFNLLVQYRKTWLNRLGGEWLTEFQVGQDTHLATEFYQPLHEAGEWFVSPYVKVGRTSRGVFVGDDKVADYLVRGSQVGLDGGAVLGTWGQLRFGPVWTRIDAEVDTGSPILPSVKETTAGLRAQLFVDQTDHAFFPTRGYGALASAYAAMESFGSYADYQRLEGMVRGAQSWGPHTLYASASGGTDLGSGMPAYESFTLGGALHLSGYRINQFAGRRYAFGRLMYYHRAFPLPDILGSGVYVGTSAEIGRITDRYDGVPSAGTLWSGSAFLGADTSVGPAYLGFGLGPSGNWSVYLLLGAP